MPTREAGDELTFASLKHYQDKWCHLFLQRDRIHSALKDKAAIHQVREIPGRAISSADLIAATFDETS